MLNTNTTKPRPRPQHRTINGARALAEARRARGARLAVASAITEIENDPTPTTARAAAVRIGALVAHELVDEGDAWRRLLAAATQSGDVDPEVRIALSHGFGEGRCSGALPPELRADAGAPDRSVRRRGDAPAVVRGRRERTLASPLPPPQAPAERSRPARLDLIGCGPFPGPNHGPRGPSAHPPPAVGIRRSATKPGGAR